MASNFAIGTINGGGDLGAGVKAATSRDAFEGYAITAITANLTENYFNEWTGTTTDPVTGKVTTNLSTWKGIGQFAASQGLQNGTSVALSKIMGQGGDLGDALQSTLFNTLAAASFNAVGDYAPGADGSLQKIMVHAMVGGLLAQVSGGDFRTGALAAGANEALVDQLRTWVGSDKDLLSMTSQIVGLLAAATLSGADGDSLQTGAWIAENATQYNYLNHREVVEMLREIDGQATEEGKSSVRERYADLDERRNKELASICQSNPASCDTLATQLMDDDPKLRALANDLKARGQYDQAAIVGVLITNSNITAGLSIATELAAARDGDDSRFDSAFAGAMLGSVLGGMRPSGVSSAKVGMLGEGGVQTASKTIWKGSGKERIDVENPNPGQRPGQIHYQDNSGNKYLYDPISKSFPAAPKSVNSLLADSRFKKAIEKGMTKYLGE